MFDLSQSDLKVHYLSLFLFYYFNTVTYYVFYIILLFRVSQIIKTVVAGKINKYIHNDKSKYPVLAFTNLITFD